MSMPNLELNLGGIKSSHPRAAIRLSSPLIWVIVGVITTVCTVFMAKLPLYRQGFVAGDSRGFPQPTPEVIRFSIGHVKAGQRFEIIGNNFSNTAGDNKVTFTGDGTTPPTPPVTVSADRVSVIPAPPPGGGTMELSLLTPYNAGSGAIKVKFMQDSNPSPTPMLVDTSVSGYVLDEDDHKLGVPSADVVYPGINPIREDTSSDGGFLMTGMGSTLGRFQVNRKGGNPNYAEDQRRVDEDVVGRDLHYDEFIFLRRFTGPPVYSAATGRIANTGSAQFSLLRQSSASSSQKANEANVKSRISSAKPAVLQIPPDAVVSFPEGTKFRKLFLDVFEHGRAPAPLPPQRYSSTIVQIAPFGVKISPGAKLIFQNRDGLAPGAKVPLFRYDLNNDSQTLGRFVQVGMATVRSDGKYVETEKNEIQETSYFFVSPTWDVGKLSGQVTRQDGSPTSGAIVIARGQYTHTNSAGMFTLPGVPVRYGESDLVRVETSILRPDGRVDVAKRDNISIVRNQEKSIGPALVLSKSPVNTSPRILGLVDLNLRAGETHNFGFKVIDPESKKKPRVSVAGAQFATIILRRVLWCNKYQLRLAPKDSDVGTHELTLRAVDNLNASAVQRIMVTVNKR